MARKLTSLSAQAFLGALLLQAVLLPLLYFGLLAISWADHEAVFIDHARSYSRMYADILETDADRFDEADLVASLDSVMLGGRSAFAALQIGDVLILSSLLDPVDAESFAEDYEIGTHGDGIYYISTPLQLGNEMATLQLGFDEAPTMEKFEEERRRIIYLLGSYLVISLALIGAMSRRVSRPIKKLRHDSRKIASGDYSRQLAVSSNIDEIRDLGHDLEEMRINLVAIGEKLRMEIAEREAAEAEKSRIEGQLQHAQRLQSIGTLAGGVAHEFNNVLLPILFYTDLALEDLPAESPIRGNLRRVIDLATRAKGLTQQILTFGRLSSDEARVALDIAPIVEEAISLVRALIPVSIEIWADIEQDAGTVFCDATEIQQLVVNLCSNAYLALAHTGSNIGVSVTRQQISSDFASKYAHLSEGLYVELKVTDDGVGMNKETVNRMFEPFYTTREVGKGTGLGLSVVHGIAVRHGGEIVVNSVPGRGTTVAVYLPVADGQASNETTGQAA
jgi:signal transduction histidine kinase